MCAVEQVAEDGTSETKGVGTVDTKLVCASCVGVHQQVGSAVCIFLYNLVFGMCLLTLFEIHFLTRPFVIIRRQWQINAG